MAQIIQISTERAPHDPRSGGNESTKVEAMKIRNGDVEISRTFRGDDRRILTVIPKEQRAALAQFLVENE